MWSGRSALCWKNWPHKKPQGGELSRLITFVDDRPGRDVMPSTRRKSPASWAGRRRKPSKAGCEKPFSGISPMRAGGKTRAGWQLSGRTLRTENAKRQVLTHGGETNERHHSGGRFGTVASITRAAYQSAGLQCLSGGDYWRNGWLWMMMV